MYDYLTNYAPSDFRPRKGIKAINVGLGIAHNLEVYIRPGFVERVYEILNENTIEETDINDAYYDIYINDLPTYWASYPDIYDTQLFPVREKELIYQFLLPYSSSGEVYEIQLSTYLYEAIVHVFARELQLHRLGPSAGIGPVTTFELPDLVIDLVYYDSIGTKYSSEVHMMLVRYPLVNHSTHITTYFELATVI